MEATASPLSASWYAVHTRSNFEKMVAGELAAKEIQTFLPAFREVRRWKDRRKELQVPVFPGYVFVRIVDDPAVRLRVLRTNGTVRILGPGSDIEAIPDFEIDGIRQLLGARVPFFSHPFLQEGAWVRVKYGPLQGVEGTLARIKSQSRLVLSVQMLSQAVATEIDADDVQVIRPKACPY